MSGPVTFHISSTTVPNNSFRCMMLSDGEMWLKSSIFVEWRYRAYSIGESLFTFFASSRKARSGEDVNNSLKFDQWRKWWQFTKFYPKFPKCTCWRKLQIWRGRKFHRRYFKAKMKPFINFVVILTVMGNTLSTGHWVDLGKIIFCQNMSY